MKKKLLSLICFFIIYLFNFGLCVQHDDDIFQELLIRKKLLPAKIRLKSGTNPTRYQYLYYSFNDSTKTNCQKLEIGDLTATQATTTTFIDCGTINLNEYIETPTEYNAISFNIFPVNEANPTTRYWCIRTNHKNSMLYLGVKIDTTTACQDGKPCGSLVLVGGNSSTDCALSTNPEGEKDGILSGTVDVYTKFYFVSPRADFENYNIYVKIKTTGASPVTESYYLTAIDVADDQTFITSYLESSLTGYVSGTVSGDTLASPTLTGTGSGIFTGTFTNTGSFTFTGTPDGTSTVSGTVSGLVRGSVTGSGTVAVSGTVTGSVTGSVSLTLTGTVRGNVNADGTGGPFTGTVSGIYKTFRLSTIKDVKIQYYSSSIFNLSYCEFYAIISNKVQCFTVYKPNDNLANQQYVYIMGVSTSEAYNTIGSSFELSNDFFKSGDAEDAAYITGNVLTNTLSLDTKLIQPSRIFKIKNAPTLSATNDQVILWNMAGLSIISIPIVVDNASTLSCTVEDNHKIYISQCDDLSIKSLAKGNEKFFKLSRKCGATDEYEIFVERESSSSLYGNIVVAKSSPSVRSCFKIFLSGDVISS